MGKTKNIFIVFVFTIYERIEFRMNKCILFRYRHILSIHRVKLLQLIAVFAPSEPTIAVIYEVFLLYIFIFIPLLAPKQSFIFIKVIIIDFEPMWVCRILPLADN